MKDFTYFAPETLEEALSLLSRYQDESKIIAGGQSLLILMRQGLVTPEPLIDIRGVSSLDYITCDENEGLSIGALTPHRAIEESPVIRERFPALAEMEEKVASVQTRNWGTIGGNLCHSDPAGDPAPVLIAMNAKVKISSTRGERVVAVEDFAVDYFETVLAPDEILTEIQVPIPPPHSGTAYDKFSKREGDMAIVGTAVSLTLDSRTGKGREARIVLNAVASVPVRAKNAEKLLAGKEISLALLDEAGRAAAGEISPGADIHASEEYRSKLIKVMVKRVAQAAFANASRA